MKHNNSTELLGDPFFEALRTIRRLPEKVSRKGFRKPFQEDIRRWQWIPERDPGKGLMEMVPRKKSLQKRFPGTN